MKLHAPRTYRLRRRALGLVSLLFKVAMVIFFLFPFYWMITTAFKTYGESIQFPPTLWPETFTPEAFADVWQRIDIPRYFKNSLLVALGVVVLQALFNIPAAYGFARYEFKGKKWMWALVMLAFMIPTQITFVPVYILFSKAKLLGTLWPQILPFAANAYGIFLMRQSFLQVPDELVEAARMDNASEMRILVRIMLPMCRSSIITAELFSFISTWNSYFWPLVMTNSDKVRPLTLAMQRLQDAHQGLEWPVLMAANSLLVLPVLLLFLLLSRQILSSFGYRGIK
ncbi:MAG TPA: carbohydrate ABC transporter permease [Candidatus Flavonifractor merdigallinarum]|uniref:Carbohydrate ABC transporter permease n=1 Tax=Candidatus Flavonifractor merdigallinarum TaxID=2838589 RepID=A0A9D1YDP4_9FIRM|nr:carbohydrate ABC transporter permease [Candidatus Flavonifractor merdigallinarum]